MMIASLIPTQSGLRDVEQIPAMVEFVQGGGFFSRNAIANWDNEHTSLIELARFPDGKVYVLDGHSRTFSILEGGRNQLDPLEYVVYDWSYDDFDQINYDSNWLTPFDPRVEVRVPDFFGFKDHVRMLWAEQSPQHAMHYVYTNRDLYTEQRSFDDIASLRPEELQ